VKTHKGSAKRFRVGARGRIKAAHSSANHLKSGKSAKRRRRIRRGSLLKGALVDRMRAWVPRK
jgi:large subunit ribosomal protein L35